MTSRSIFCRGARHLPASRLTFGLVLLLGCSSAGSGPGSGGAPGTGGKSSSGGASGTGGNASGGASAGSGGAGTGGAASGGSGSGGAATGGSGSGGTSGSGGSGSGGAGTGGSGSSTGGSSGGGGVMGGSGGGSGSGGAGTGGGAGSAGTGGANGGSSGSGACPADATFCSGFEDTALPKGAVYKLNGDPATPWTKDFVIDTNVFHAGKSSLRVKANNDSTGSSSAYKMLAVPATKGAFWARFWFRSDVDLGGHSHNSFTMGAIDDEAKKEGSIEFAEDVGIAFNASDSVRWPDGYGRPSGGGEKPYTLAKATWFCVELSYDGTKRVQQLFINNKQLINATDYPTAALAVSFFKFGYFAVNGTTRQMWYDDVAVTPTRIGDCPTQ